MYREDFMNFWDNFYYLCKKNGKSPNGVAKELNIPSGTVTWWKKGKTPHKDTLVILANYFNVSIGYLLGYEQKEKVPSIEETSNVSDIYQQNIRMIPIYENASAGFGALAVDYVIDYEAIYIPNITEARNTICIKVKGDSMFPKIEDGDIIQVHKQDTIESGSIGVVMIDEDAFVKKIVYGEDWLELHSINPMFKTVRYNGKDAEKVRVVGLVKRIFKEC